MNWDAIGAVAELVGAAGVILSLVYLGVQIRLNTRQMADQNKSLRLAALEGTTASFSRFRDPLIRDPACAALWNRALEDFDALSPDEKTQASAMLQEIFFCYQALYRRVREDAYSEPTWQQYREIVRLQLQSAGVQQWWRQAHRFYAPDFVAEVGDASAGSGESAA